MASSSQTLPDPVVVRDALRRITRSTFVAEGSLLATMLTYVVEETLGGNARAIKAYTIAVEALGRGADFDPDRDSTVRVAAMRLRQALELYYAGPGALDPMRIRLVPGSYRPSFETVDHARADAPVAAVTVPAAPVAAPVAAALAPASRRFRIPTMAAWLGAITVILAIDVAMTVSLMAVQGRSETALLETQARLTAEDIRAAEKRTADQIVYDIIREDIQRSYQQRVE